jgi:hypothetical protein
MEARLLLMKRLRTETTYVLELPQEVPQWHVHINLREADSVVEVLPVGLDDKLPSVDELPPEARSELLG